MNTLTIPKTLTRGEELIVIPRKEYEEFLRSKNVISRNIVVKRSKSFRVPKKYEKFYDELDKELTKSLKDYYEGRYYGPFETANELIQSLHRKR
ncbi:MAG: hypothetical protein A3G49_02820 [Candidatus Sungbacteria bacterium RIFCSPLOWO2_12_FULL_41_11]|uniref:Uncharacterized protein n=1 Tax=Candidatus Sungbacteria bacterium RIFCSPLOWO2_12_FULL_41_11 TaxID=1802286 RepID=A0A1G2LTH5_9BACT|nr:MAG: hypothetical protein UV01_C0001G0072 [Parcubacteria group bacterium GW2011_GWA2_42_14]OHA00259.1 MAG: hypothetical protein A3D41_01870 [Candidatus Sungbacteria bacterium RIFCSPHIGHO2_02_FULL_41_12b]OHA14149.1 MAG: hypothetical protein A3G49_02820 [Candidatus Sungbacteria bacterium RIFCSPLOWO2_12_FULL_41_11]